MNPWPRSAENALDHANSLWPRHRSGHQLGVVGRARGRPPITGGTGRRHGEGLSGCSATCRQPLPRSDDAKIGTLALANRIALQHPAHQPHPGLHPGDWVRRQCSGPGLGTAKHLADRWGRRGRTALDWQPAILGQTLSSASPIGTFRRVVAHLITTDYQAP